MNDAAMIWNVLAALLVGFAYLSTFVFVGGLSLRLALYIKTPVPLKIVQTPGPKSAPGVVARIAGDVLIFPNLFQADKLLWLGAWIFHACLFLILVRHTRYFLYPVPELVIDWQTISVYAGFFFPIPALYLFWRRLASSRMLYISGLPDYITLILLTAIASTGMLVHYFARVYLVDVKAFTLGLVTFAPVQPPQHPIFVVHFILVCSLLIWFPFSKLMHAGGVFFSPTRNQIDNVLYPRYVNKWNEEVRVD
ncbi:MAG: respiratory nitrate reductase subunit gamma [Anaerolineales bacterium]|nr:respiratory nitrate reductase subunit gamma [Anaerolineales bacterium]